MWIIISEQRCFPYLNSEQGCFPYLNLEVNGDGHPLSFETKDAADAWGKENCAWQYKVIEW